MSSPRSRLRRLLWSRLLRRRNGKSRLSSSRSRRLPEEIYEEFLATATNRRNDKHLAALAEFDPSLRGQISELDMSRSQLTDQGTEYLSAFPNLEELKIDYSGITGGSTPLIGELRNLKHLSMAGTRIGEAGLAGIAGLTDLEYLNFGSTAAHDLSFEHLLGMKNLQVLAISDLRSLNGQGLAELAKRGVLTNLRELHASNTQIGNYGLEGLKHMPHLEVLILNSAGVNDIHTPLIGSRKELVRLSLERNKIGSDGVKPLAKLKNLELLNLAGCKSVKDEAFNYLKNLKNLKVLNVSGTGVTPGAVETLQEKFLPDTDIKYDKPR